MKKLFSIMLVCIFAFNTTMVNFTAYANENTRVFEEENTDIDEDMPDFVFSPIVYETMAGADSFVNKIASTDSFDVSARTAILIEETSGQVLYEKDADQKVAIASITKVMTLLLVFEALEAGKFTLGDTVPISSHAFSMGGSQIWLEPGEIFTVKELIKAVAISSANDAAVALAEFVAGTEEAFCDMMNNKAKELGMTNTHFVNACGLDAEGHLSSARDVSIMSRELMKHEAVYEYTTTWMDYVRDGSTQMVNTNKLLRSYSGITGLKTGTTSIAGVCIAATAKRDGLSLIAVVLGSDSSQERFAAAKKLLDFGFANFETKEFPQGEEIAKTMKVKKGITQEAELIYDLPEKLLFLKGSTSQITYKVEMPEYITAPMYKGMKVGSVTLYSEQGKIKEYDITLKEDIPKITFNIAFSKMLNSVGKM